MLTIVVFILFMSIAGYGILTMQYGAAIISVIAAAIYYWADKRMSALEQRRQS